MTAKGLRGRRLRLVALLGAAMLLATALPGPALAVAPANDSIASPTIVDTFPYADGPVDTTEATTGATDPAFCHEEEAGPDRATVWYSFTPDADGDYLADTFGSDYDTTLYVGTADGSGGIDVIGCIDDSQSLQSAVIWSGTAGTTYLIAVGTCCGGGVVGESGDGGGTLEFHVGDAPPPIDLSLALSPTATVSGYGSVTLRGTVTCENGDFLNLAFDIEQVIGRFTLRGFAFVETACDGTQPFEVELTSDDGRFRGGRINAFAFAESCSSFACTQVFEEGRIRLRR